MTSSQAHIEAEKRDQRQLEDLFAIDFRGLAAFRILIAGILVARCLHGLLGGGLFLPDEAWAWKVPGVSAEMPATGWAINIVCWLLLLGFSGLLLLGLRTWLATLVCWALMLIHVHGIMGASKVDIGTYLNAGVLLWMLFLPVSQRASLDRDPPNAKITQQRFLSFATAALLLQPLFVYFSAGITKNKQDWIVQGDALYHLMHTSWATPLGRWLLNFPELLSVLTRATMVLEIIVPICFLWVGRGAATIRTSLVVIYTLFHLATAATIHLDVIPFLCIAFLLLYLPPSVWDRLTASGPTTKITTLSDPIRWRNRLAGCALALMIVSFLLSVVWFHDESRTLRQIHQSYPKIGLYQGWAMFNRPSFLRQQEEAQQAKVLNAPITQEK